MGKNENYFAGRSPLSGFLPLILLVIFFFLMYQVASGIFFILSWLALPLIILALILDYKVVVNYVKYIIDLSTRKPLHGIGLGVLTVLGYPFVSAFLAFRAFMSKKISDLTGEEKKKEVYTEYEEVEDEEDFLELEPIEKPEVIKETKQSGNDYEELFE